MKTRLSDAKVFYPKLSEGERERESVRFPLPSSHTMSYYDPFSRKTNYKSSIIFKA